MYHLRSCLRKFCFIGSLSGRIGIVSHRCIIGSGPRIVSIFVFFGNRSIGTGTLLCRCGRLEIGSSRISRIDSTYH